MFMTPFQIFQDCSIASPGAAGHGRREDAKEQEPGLVQRSEGKRPLEGHEPSVASCLPLQKQSQLAPSPASLRWSLSDMALAPGGTDRLQLP